MRKVSYWLSGIAVMAAFSFGLAPTLAQASDLDSFDETEFVTIDAVYSLDDPFSLDLSRSWYGDSFSFKDYSCWILPRYYDGNNVGIEMNTQCSASGSFSISLYKGSTLIGTSYQSLNGFVKADWTNVGSGYFRFLLTKSCDAELSCTNVALYSW